VRAWRRRGGHGDKCMRGERKDIDAEGAKRSATFRHGCGHVH
jgi:hypothetical protein